MKSILVIILSLSFASYNMPSSVEINCGLRCDGAEYGGCLGDKCGTEFCCCYGMDMGGAPATCPDGKVICSQARHH